MFLKFSDDTKQHAPSYYAATANWQTDYPELEEAIEADVAIVGGGFSGVATAVELSERGYKVVLLESNRIGWGASGRNGGQIIGGYGQNPGAFRSTIGSEGVDIVEGMGVECVDIIKQRIEKYNINCDLKWGYCEVGLKKRHLKAYQQWAEADPAMHLLDRDKIKEYVNSEIYLGGYYREDWGHIQPLNLCIGEAKVAQSLGAKIFENSKVTNVTYGESPVVTTEKGSVKAGHVILCGNAYMDKLVPYLDARVLPATSCIIGTEPLSNEQLQQTMARDVAVCDSRTALDYYRLSADKRLLFGGLSNYSGLEPANAKAVMRAKMAKVFPSLKNIKIDYSWSGRMGISVRRMPQIGRIKNSNVLYASGYSGHGVAPTHMTGRLLAEAVDGDTHRFDIMDKMFHLPWPGGKLLRRPAMAAGMMFYKIRDAL
ncbi:MAG: FAD-binding oxidoreductase [Porticoccaceae bacterium]|nr:FAD-binding oxidoreductase [Porticoccaceae bacterium]MBT6422990.1 FAD-binding oxidoreductase [Porticoccaceae bacterium]MBT7168398.1 FAD-binding oxidoreductase [Porticoccaceae bacterium]MBT7566005.1 FAD-binding oxidoreductase [Porticoccaceae bacterium]